MNPIAHVGEEIAADEGQVREAPDEPVETFLRALDHIGHIVEELVQLTAVKGLRQGLHAGGEHLAHELPDTKNAALQLRQNHVSEVLQGRRGLFGEERFLDHRLHGVQPVLDAGPRVVELLRRGHRRLG